MFGATCQTMVVDDEVPFPTSFAFRNAQCNAADWFSNGRWRLSAAPISTTAPCWGCETLRSMWSSRSLPKPWYCFESFCHDFTCLFILFVFAHRGHRGHCVQDTAAAFSGAGSLRGGPATNLRKACGIVVAFLTSNIPTQSPKADNRHAG